MMADDDDGTLRRWYRALSTEQLLMYREDLAHDLDRARRRPGKSPYSVAYVERRRRLIAEILGEKGVEAN